MHGQVDTSTKYWPAPAKLNLFLHIIGRGADGYHDLQSLFQILDWGDSLRFFINDTGKIARSNDVDGVPEAEDICIRAARLLQASSGVSHGVSIELNKRIPLGAGLGGGSSDAATVLLGLNHLWSCGLNQAQLAELGLELGADVPLFVYGHSSLAAGRGEQLSAVSLGQRHYVLVFPDIRISTAEVFSQPRLIRDSHPLDLAQVALRPGRNDCRSVVFEMYPELKKITQDLQKWGHPHMTGTGSTIFLAFSDKKSAIKTASELKCRYNVRAVRGIDHSGVLEMSQTAGN